MSAIGVDIDDVLYPFFDVAHELSTRAGIVGACTAPTSWSPYEDYGCTAEQWYDVLSAGAVSGELYHAEPLPGAIEALQRLREAGHTVHLVTARGLLTNGHLIRSHTVAWLENVGARFDTLTFAKDKSIVRTDVMVDDNADNLRQYRAVTGNQAVLITRPWNADVTTFARCSSFAEFADSWLYYGEYKQRHVAGLTA